MTSRLHVSDFDVMADGFVAATTECAKLYFALWYCVGVLLILNIVKSFFLSGLLELVYTDDKPSDSKLTSDGLMDMPELNKKPIKAVEKLDAMKKIMADDKDARVGTMVDPQLLEVHGMNRDSEGSTASMGGRERASTIMEKISAVWGSHLLAGKYRVSFKSIVKESLSATPSAGPSQHSDLNIGVENGEAQYFAQPMDNPMNKSHRSRGGSIMSADSESSGVTATTTDSTQADDLYCISTARLQDMDMLEKQRLHTRLLYLHNASLENCPVDDSQN